jgi:hypothetical protein
MEPMTILRDLQKRVEELEERECECNCENEATFMQVMRGMAVVACIMSAGVLAVMHPDGSAWGWFLFVGFLLYVS